MRRMQLGLPLARLASGNKLYEMHGIKLLMGLLVGNYAQLVIRK
jgi:hypothetical protein